MKILFVNTDNTISARLIYAQSQNVIQMAEIKKLLSDKIEIIVAAKISRLASIYIMFAEKESGDRPVNKVASALVGKDVPPVKGDVIIARTDHFGSGSKFFALDDDEINTVKERLTQALGYQVVFK